MEVKTARVFDIKRMAVHDGPGIRTTVFFKQTDYLPEIFMPLYSLDVRILREVDNFQ